MEHALIAPFVLFATLAAFTLSASAGLGGSLILIPSLALVMGTKEAIALGALLLGANNVAKIIVYRKTLPVRAVVFVLVMLAFGSALGATFLIFAPERYVAYGLILVLTASLIVEKRGWHMVQGVAAPALALFSGMTSGFSGTSGPLKAAALRNLRLDRANLVGAASLASLVGDATKTVFYARAQLFGSDALLLLMMSLPLIYFGTVTGKRINRKVGERGYACLFWSVMVGYSARAILVLT